MAPTKLQAYPVSLLRGVSMSRQVSSRTRLCIAAIVTAITVAMIGSSGIAATNGNAVSDTGLVMPLNSRLCPQGMHHQPNGPFAVIVFCEDALGTYIAVICYDPGICERSETPDRKIRFEGWSLASRIWQEKSWASDITSLAWSPDGKRLYLSTSEIYGTGAIYVLNLEQHTFRQLLPADAPRSVNQPANSYEITAIDSDGRHLHFTNGDPPVEHTLTLDESEH
jgi:hypothetical protein